jgi:hypothetical protein
VTEEEEAVITANTLLDVPNVDPDDDLRMLSRQLLRRHEELTQQAATIQAMRAAVELAFNAKIHPFTTDDFRNYCQCGYYETHPIHTLAALANVHTEGAGK